MKNEILEHKKRLDILHKHLKTNYYNLGQYHLAISNAMKEYVKQVNGVEYSESNISDVDNSTDLKEIFFQKVKSIAETYHDRLCMSSISMENQICKCCGSIVHHTTSIEHDSQDYSKDLSVCSNCYEHIVNYWSKNKPRKIAPI